MFSPVVEEGHLPLSVLIIVTDKAQARDYLEFLQVGRGPRRGSC